MSLPQTQPASGRNQSLSDEHLRVLGSIVTAFGHLELALLRTVRDLVPGADGPSVEALLVGDATPQLVAKFERLVKQHHTDEAICAQTVTWCRAVDEVCQQWEEEFRASWVRDRPDDALRRVRYTKTAYRGGLQVEQTSLDEVKGIEAAVSQRMSELEGLWSTLGLGGDPEPE